MNPNFKCALFLLIPTLSFEGRDTHVVPENLHKTPFFIAAYNLTWVNWIKHKKTQMACTNREKETDWDIFFFEKKSEKNYHSPKKIEKNKKNALLSGHRAGLPCCPVSRVPI